MTTASDRSLLSALLDSWDRNNAILVNLLRLVPTDELNLRATEAGPTIAEIFTHIHYCRLVFVEEDAPEFARELPTKEWMSETNVDRLAQSLNESAKVLRDAVQARLDAALGMDLHYDHPVLMLQHMIWHEGYHHGQIKLALKLAGHPISDDDATPGTWGIWMNKS